MNRPPRTVHEIREGLPHWMGAQWDGAGTNFVLFSENATRVTLCLFSSDGQREVQRLPLPERTGAVWHGYVPGLAPGARYGYRVEGPHAPDAGHRFNANKLLLDPYARQLAGQWTYDEALFGFDRRSDDLSFDNRDSAPFVPKAVVTADITPLTQPLNRGWAHTMIYEAHVKGATKRHPGVPEDQRGTFEGLASDAMLDHLTQLGVTAVELMPIHAIHSEGALLARGLTNYWGYNTIGFFVPEPRYMGPQGAAGLCEMVARFHAAGIEVILDVVYNHTAESDHLGPTLSFRGIDNAAYYRLQPEQPRYYVNDTGTGNTLNLSHPFVLRLVLDSLRFWVTQFGVDGFRFDLATTLAREAHGYDPASGFLKALRQDPVLSTVKLIVEPWDIGPGGYQLGQFPPKFAEWNDQFRDTLRRFWKGERGAAQGLGDALLGSAKVFDKAGRRAWSSVNFAAAHDGFTLADVTAYAHRHNEANGENNQDGHHANHSENFGVEGPTADPVIRAKRARRQRNLLATVFLSQGTPMLLAGDEGGHTQNGNNNAYAQDNETTWIDWASLDADQIAFTAALSAFRRATPLLRQSHFLHGTRRSDGHRDVEWLGFDGQALAWDDPDLAQVGLLIRGSADSAMADASRDAVFLVFNRSSAAAQVHLPQIAPRVWQWDLNTAHAQQSVQRVTEPVVPVASDSVAVFTAREAP